ncbi:MAG: hypothetical protein RSB76_03370, partial [Clostridia bacterium]
LIGVVSTVFIVSTLVFFIGSNIVIKLQVLHSSNETLLNITQNLKASQLKPNIEINNIINCAKCFVSFSSTYYMIIFIYIVFMEILSVMLHRRYDTKSTILKLSFVLLFMLISNFSLNLLYFQPMLTILLILIAIVDTSNIYLNREERIKMLVA